MSNSKLISYTNISPNKNSPRNHEIDTITIHCVVGQWTAKKIADYFSSASVGASPNYGVGTDGNISLCVDESDRSWCSSSASNDNRAITIEVASDTVHPYYITDKAYEALIKLIADICERNGIKKLIWSTNKSERVNHLNGCNMTVHRDFENKACPGDYLYERHGQIAEEVNKILGGKDMKFKDVPETHWAYKAIEELAEKGIIKGHDDGSFRPSGYVTRAEIAVMLARSSKHYDASVSYGNPFYDVSSKAYYHNEVAFCASRGYMVGYPDGAFKPDNNLTRAEAAVLIVRFMEGEK